MLCFTSATVVGAILSSSIVDSRMVWLLMFSAFSAAFGFVVNDLSDAELDRSAGVLRNPFSKGELSRGRGIMLAIFLFLVSMMPLFSLSLKSQLLGLVVIFLYFTYSWILRAKAWPILDIVYHGSWLAILATMGYAEYRSFNVVCLLLASLVFFLSAVSQILQEVRDYETDRKTVRTTVTLLGRKRSLVLCLAFFMSALAIFLLLLFYSVFPFEILLLSPLAYLIVAPIIQAIDNEEYEDVMLKKIRERRLIIIATLIVTLILTKK
jgi:4-hydroxybenzoate polyprenyltransferase